MCCTSADATIAAPNIPNTWLALNIGVPHWNGYGMLILLKNENWATDSKDIWPWMQKKKQEYKKQTKEQRT